LSSLGEISAGFLSEERLFHIVTAEQAFYAMKLAKTYLRTKLGYNFHDCVVVYIEREIIEAFDLGGS
jgi:hypothetical protein